MKFLCMPCDEAMKLKRTQGPDEGSFAVVFECPSCGWETAMLTNSMETQMVRSLGVKIGGRTVPAEPMEMVRGSLAQGHKDIEAGGTSGGETSESKCPFTGVINDAYAQNENAPEIVWTKEARDWLQERAKFFGLKNLKFVVKNLEDVKEKYDTVLLMDLINRIQDGMIDEVLHGSRKVISKKGNIIMGSLNKNSVYGFLFRKGVGRRYGPEISLSHKKVKGFIDDNKLKIKNPN